MSKGDQNTLSVYIVIRAAQNANTYNSHIRKRFETSQFTLTNKQASNNTFTCAVHQFPYAIASDQMSLTFQEFVQVKKKCSKNYNWYDFRIYSLSSVFFRQFGCFRSRNHFEKSIVDSMALENKKIERQHRAKENT